MKHRLLPIGATQLDPTGVRLVAELTAAGALVRFCSCAPTSVVFAARDTAGLDELMDRHLAAVTAASMSRHPSSRPLSGP